MQRPTRLGILIMAAGVSCFLLALALHTLAPALLGIVLVVWVRCARVPSLMVSAERTLPERVVVGEEFEIVTVARLASRAPIFIDAPAQAGLTILETRTQSMPGVTTMTQRAIAAAPGALVWADVKARVQDAGGLVEERVDIPQRSHVFVMPSTRSLVEGERLGRKTSFRQRAKRPGSDDEPEIDRLRDHQPGDRFRDIDWAHTSRLGRLIVRQMKHEPRRPLVILFDANEGVRRVKLHSKLATGSHAALLIAAAARAGGLPVGFVAWTERGVEAQVKAIATRRALSEAVTRLSTLPPGQVTDAAPRTTSDEHVELHAAERDFLAATGMFSFHQLGAHTPLEGALHAVSKVSPQPALVVVFLDVENDPALAATVARRLRQRGHRAIIVGYASGSHHYSLSEVDDSVLSRLIAWRVNREHARRGAQRHRAAFHILKPRPGTLEIQEVIRSAR